MNYSVSELGEDDLRHEQILVVKHLVSEDEVPEESDIAVWEIEGLIDQDIWVSC